MMLLTEAQKSALFIILYIIMLQLWVQSYDFILRFSHSSLRNIVCRRSFRIISPVWRGRTGGRVIFEASLRRGVRKSLSLPHFKNNSIFSSLFVSDCQNFCTFAPAFRKECKRHIETTKRYARLAYGNVRNFQKELQGRYIGSRV